MLLSIEDSYCQKEGNIGVFGNGVALDFNSIPLDVFVIPKGSFATEEGSASISDSEGKLLFYTNGAQVYNREHSIMPNGLDISGPGYSTTTTQVVIVPKPGSSFFYYIFTAGYQGGHLKYTLIDMRLNAGLGGIVFKDNLIYNYTTEKLCVVAESTKKWFWLITHEYGTNKFRTFKVTENGLDTIAIKSSVGEIQKKNQYGSSATGYLKASSSGTRLASAVNDVFGTSCVLELFDFNKSTGVITNPMKLYSNIFGNSYGVEFSPDESKLYNTRISSKELYQYDLYAGDVQAIINSAKLISSDVWGALQLAPDGRIYAVGKRDAAYLDVIERPNLSGTECRFVKDAVHLKGKKVYLGLPVFSYEILRPDIITLNACQNEPIKFSLGNTNNVASVNWSFGDAASVINTSNLLSPNHVYVNPGSYSVTADVVLKNNVTMSYNTIVSVFDKPIISLGNDRSLCVGTEFRAEVSSPSSMLRYRWHNGNGTSWYAIKSPGKYWVEAFNEYCSASDTLNVTEKDKPFFEVDDTVICKNKSLIVTLNVPDAVFTWNDGFQGNSRVLTDDGMYIVHSQNECGEYTDIFTVSKLPYLKLNLGNDTILCRNKTLTFNIFTESANYRWNDQSDSDTKTITEPGDYWVEVYNQCESLTDTIKIKYLNLNDVFLPNVITPDGNGLNDQFMIDSYIIVPTLSIFNRWGKQVYFSEDYQNNWDANGLDAGTYYYLINDGCSFEKIKGWITVVK